MVNQAECLGALHCMTIGRYFCSSSPLTLILYRRRSTCRRRRRCCATDLAMGSGNAHADEGEDVVGKARQMLDHRAAPSYLALLFATGRLARSRDRSRIFNNKNVRLWAAKS